MAIRTLDLFHGAGGSSMGAQMAGAQIVAGIDYWAIATDSYRKNFSKTMTINADIRAVCPERLHGVTGDIDLIIASPECTNHSCAKGGAARDEESRLTAFQVIRFAREFRPEWIVIENVVQMRTWNRHQDLLTELGTLGYFVKQERFNACDFGVPQTRRRLFLICSINGESVEVTPNRRRTRAAREIIDFDADYHCSPLFTHDRASATLERAERAMATLGHREPFLIVYYGTDGSGGWQSIDRPLRTITTLDRFALVKPTAVGHVMRMLQPEELKQGMGFPASYRLDSGSRRDRIKLMGNAVCPPVMEAVVRALLSR